MIVAALLLAAQISVSELLWIEEGDGFSFRVDYPVIAQEEEIIGSALEGYALRQIHIFMKSFGEYYMPEFGLDWNHEIIFVHEPSPDGMICISAYSWDFSGGAHGNSWTRAFNYDTRSREFLGPVELLGGEAQFEAFAEEAMTRLHEMVDDPNWIDDGASADPENYHSILPYPNEEGRIEGYRVLFPAYQVAAYVYGPQEVWIPAGE